MKNKICKLLCCGTAAFMLLASAAGCSAGTKDNRSGSGDPDKTVKTSASEKAEAGDLLPEDTEETAGEPSQDLSNAAPFADSGTIGGLDYKIEHTSTEGAASDEVGYYVFSTSDEKYPVAVIIAAGEFNTGGHDIRIINMEYDGSELVITVRETAPGPDDMVTQAFTYPVCGVELSKLPDSFKVVSEGGYEYSCLYVYHNEYEIEPGWFAVIEDGAGEIMYKTYVYETADGKYSYINVVSTTVSYGSPVWNNVVKGSGFADTREDIVEKAKEFGSCGFVLRAGDSGTVYTVDEFLAAKAF